MTARSGDEQYPYVPYVPYVESMTIAIAPRDNLIDVDSRGVRYMIVRLAYKPVCEFFAVAV